MRKLCAPGGDEIAVQGEAEAARLLHAKDLEALGHPRLHLRHELFAGELARGLEAGVIFLADGGDGLEMDIQAEGEAGLGGVQHGRGQRLARGHGARHRGLAGGGGGGYGGGCHGGFEDVFFHKCVELLLDRLTQRGAEWRCVQPIMASNPAIARQLQSMRPVGRVAELGALGRWSARASRTQHKSK